MDALEMDYWRDKPKDWLIDEAFNGITPEEFMGYFWIRQRNRAQSLLPGVIAGGQQTLQRWSRLTPAQFKRARRRIFSFLMVDGAGNYHDEVTKNDYRSYAKIVHETREMKKRAANIRHQGKKSASGQGIPPFVDPFRSFGPLKPAVDTLVENDQPLFLQKNEVDARAMQVHAGASPIDRQTESLGGCTGPAPPGCAAASPRPPDPQPDNHPKNGHGTKPLTPEQIAIRRAEAMAALERMSAAEAAQNDPKAVETKEL